MKDTHYIIVLFVLIFQLAAQGRVLCQKPEALREVYPEQLKGLKSVSLVVYVSSFDIPNSEEIKQKIERTAKKMLKKTGLSIGSEQRAVFSILVYPYMINEPPLPDYLMVQVRTRLNEDAALKRDPSLRNPHGYVTWDCDWVGLIRRAELVTRILEEVKDQVEDFCTDWELVRDLKKNESSAKKNQEYKPCEKRQ